jgi:hypothetical protein
VTGPRDGIDPASDPPNAHEIARAGVLADDRERSDWSVGRRHVERIADPRRRMGNRAKPLASLCTPLPITKWRSAKPLQQDRAAGERHQRGPMKLNVLAVLRAGGS